MASNCLKNIITLAWMLLMVAPLFGQTYDEKYFLDIEKQRTDAIASKDANFLEGLFDESFQGVAASGALVNKADQLSIYKSRNSFVLFTYEDLHATVSGNVAIITGTQAARSKTGSTLGEMRYLFIYGKRDGKWKIVMGQETDVIRK